MAFPFSFGWSLWDLSSLPRDRTHAPSNGALTTGLPGKSLQLTLDSTLAKPLVVYPVTIKNHILATLILSISWLTFYSPLLEPVAIWKREFKTFYIKKFQVENSYPERLYMAPAPLLASSPTKGQEGQWRSGLILYRTEPSVGGGETPAWGGGGQSRLAEDANQVEGTGQGMSGSQTDWPWVILRWWPGQEGWQGAGWMRAWGERRRSRRAILGYWSGKSFTERAGPPQNPVQGRALKGLIPCWKYRCNRNLQRSAQVVPPSLSWLPFFPLQVFRSQHVWQKETQWEVKGH